MNIMFVAQTQGWNTRCWRGPKSFANLMDPSHPPGNPIPYLLTCCKQSELRSFEARILTWHTGLTVMSERVNADVENYLSIASLSACSKLKHTRDH